MNFTPKERSHLFLKGWEINPHGGSATKGFHKLVKDHLGLFLYAWDADDEDCNGGYWVNDNVLETIYDLPDVKD